MFTETVKSIAYKNSIDIRAASYRLREELEQYRELGLLEKSIENVQRQMQAVQQKLTAFNITHADKEAALTLLAELQNKGATIWVG